MGYTTYGDYLLSELWDSIRERVWHEKGESCTCCGRAASEIHHQSYAPKVLRGDDIKPLIPLCKRCHKKAEIDDKGNKRDIQQVHKAIRKLKASRGLRCS